MKNTKNNKFLDLKFCLTEEMNNIMIEMLITQQMLRDSSFDKEDKILLENHKQELMEQFKIEFQKNNREQIKRYNELINK